MKKTYVKKRDGRLKCFDIDFIINAIKKCCIEVLGETDGVKCLEDNFNFLIPYIEKRIDSLGGEIIEIEAIQDIIVEALDKYCVSAISKVYQEYRDKRTVERNTNSNLYKSVLGLIANTNEEVAKENSNKDSVLVSTQRDLIAGEISKEIAKNKLIPKHIVKAHDEGTIHWHDMDYTLQSIHNCGLVDLENMFANGTVINGKLVETPKSFQTACTVATQIMTAVSSSQYGGQSITIKHLAPYLRVTYNRELEKALKKYDKDTAIKIAQYITDKELVSGVQTIRYQLNTMNSTNGQSPFATIYLEIEEGSECEKEQALICEEMIKQRLEGMKNYKGQEIGEAFPKLVYLLDEHNCLEGGKYDYITKLAAKCTAKRLVPDYQSAKIMRKNYEGNTFPPMGCRSHLSPWKDENGNYKWYGRFNQGVISLNLPQIAILSNKDMDKFNQLLEERLELCKEALLVRHELLEGTVSDVAPILWQHGALARLKKGEKIDELLHNGYSTISLGYVGICEMVQSMLGVSNTTKEGEQFALEVLTKMKSACDKWKKETGLGFGLYGSPAENLIYRFCKIDKTRFGDIPNVTDKLYYTNSYHVHVCEEIDAFSKLKFESQFHDISLGGCISYVEVPDMSNNLEAVEQLINYIYHNIQYAELNTKPDICYKCGFKGEIKNNEQLEWYCPNCGNKDENEMQVMRRTCGYIGTNFWNKGRTSEIKERVIHL